VSGVSKIAGVLGKGAPAPADDEDDAPDSEPGGAPDELELKAFKAFKSASTPEDGALALKTFIKACMAGGGY